MSSGTGQHPDLELSAAVQQSLEDGRPVLALESTIISHGMPWPRNFETAISVQQAVRAEGVEPATVATVEPGKSFGPCICELSR